MNVKFNAEGQSTPSLAICKQEPAPRGAERTDASTHAAQVQDHGAAAGGNSCRPAQGGAVEHRAAPVPKNGQVNLPIQGDLSRLHSTVGKNLPSLHIILKT